MNGSMRILQIIQTFMLLGILLCLLGIGVMQIQMKSELTSLTTDFRGLRDQVNTLDGRVTKIEERERQK